ncbi:MAG: SusD/RagB family nutrient-binding outer membrane lipoprotein [Prevotellaceae bacterium]|jgi:hypothetical protein|nr:SusD/RagB family nutrient-binding outer membrane lipoprotein [Prevotellaceae bacterium]
MKKIISILTVLAFVFTFSQCSEEDYNEKYADPNKATTILFDKLMVGIFIKSHNYTLHGYSRFFSTDSQWTGKYAQTFGFYLGGNMWHNGHTVVGHFNEFYSGVAVNFKKMEDMYNSLPDEGKAMNEAYYLASKVVTYNVLLHYLDIYGDMPWKDACKVAVTGKFSQSNAHYDKAEDLYKMIIDEMKDAGLRFPSVSLPRGFTATNDYINNADRSKWQIYANCVCLRAAIRVASQGSQTQHGRTAIKEILENPARYPIVDDIEANIHIKNMRTDPVNAEGGGGLDAWKSCRLASAAIIRNMLSNYTKTTWSGTYQDGTDDPRLPLLYNLATLNAGNIVDGTIRGTVYRGVNTEMTETVLSQYDQGNSLSEIRRGGFFWENQNWDHFLFSAPELWFIKAESYLNGWAAGGEAKAKDAFKEGIKQSIRFFFKYQDNKTREDYTGDTDYRSYVINPAEPSDTWIDTFAEARWNTKINGDAYDTTNPRLDAIITQKWLSFSMMESREAWADLRRTGYPSGLIFPQAADAEIPNVPARWRYSPNERNFNKNFSEVAEQDNYTTKMFWAK